MNIVLRVQLYNGQHRPGIMSYIPAITIPKATRRKKIMGIKKCGIHGMRGHTLAHGRTCLNRERGRYNMSGPLPAPAHSEGPGGVAGEYGKHESG